ncbi:copper chaperone PCu(A)C [Campylobacter fetus]|uniref:copper chaperone PCu(A)C n=1 Tax=Campylobacter fetus TaxID=196 RepID=UPI000FCB7F70|nr:copper chaperone PCu(A)C [Campylobacter fetus]QQF52333.1 copper chaperone PCu(A)C [Campylobacter fetus subsp. venerealis]RUT50366.1 hypothetical protein BWK67_04050 [Campylobacter fetus]RUT50683.1 hypothetical protein BWK51_04030 [Campylobacter fetus]
MFKFTLSCALLSSLCFAANIDIESPFVKATPPNAKTSAAFMIIKNNTNKDVSLVSGNSNASKVFEIHTHLNENGMKKMVRIPKIDIPANSSVELKPGGLHIMLIDINKPLEITDKVDLTLEFSDSSKIDLKDVEVKKLAPMMKPQGSM